MNVKSKVGLRGRILEIIPVSVYQEIVYTQDIFIELENFVKLRISDIHTLCEQKDLGKVKNLYIKATIIRPFKKCEVIEPNIAPIELMDKEPTSPDAIISGTLEEIVFPEDSSGQMYGIVNVGIGKIALVLLRKHLDVLKEGDCIHFDSAPLYLYEIED
jgi:hypothetical protein